MTKITKKEYNTMKIELQAKITNMKKKLQALLDWSDTLDYNNLTEHTRHKLNVIGEYWNGLHDKQRDLEKELDSLDNRWDTRNWTGSDWNTYALMVANID